VAAIMAETIFSILAPCPPVPFREPSCSLAGTLV